MALTAQAARSAPREHAAITDSWISVDLSGAAWATRTFEKVTIVESDSFFEWYDIRVEDRNGRVAPATPPLQAVVSTGLHTWTNTQISCTGLFRQSPSDIGTSGVRTWFSADHGSYPDPGPHNVLVTGTSNGTVNVGPWSGLSSGTGSCSGGMDFFSLAPDFEHTLTCALHAGGSCAETFSFPVSTKSSNGTTDSGAGTFKLVARRVPDKPDTTIIPELLDLFIPDFPPTPSLWQWPPLREPPSVLIPTTAKVPSSDGTLDGQVMIAKQPLVKARGKIRKGLRPRLALSWSSAGLARARRLRAPTPATVTLTLTPRRGAPVTLTRLIYLVPAPKGSTGTSGTGGGGAPPGAATITSVAFSGTPRNPSFVIHGRNLGSKPTPNPAGHPSGVNGCPTVARDNGYDYGTSLYIAVPARNWSGGRYRPSLNETDCVDLVVTRFTETEVDFHFGPFYATNNASYPLVTGDEVQVAVNSAVKAVHFKSGVTVTS